MDKDRFCKAAADGHLDLLRHTTKKDCNDQDEDGFSPVLWASYSGRGGDPDKPDLLGNTSLHWAAANGHYHIVTFLCNFGCNIWSLNNDYQTAPGVKNYLDNIMAKQSALNPKLVQKSKEKAIIDAEKNIKNFEKIQRKATKKAEKEEKQNERNRRKLLEPIQITNNNRLQPVEYSTLTTGTLRWTTTTSQKHKGNAPLKFSDLVNNTNTIRTNQFNSLLSNVKGTLTNSTSSRLVKHFGAVSRKVQLKKQTSNLDENQKTSIVQQNNQNDNLNKNLQTSTIRSLTGLCRDTDVLYVRKETDYGLLNYNNKLNGSLITTNCLNSLKNIETNNTIRIEDDCKKKKELISSLNNDEDKKSLINKTNSVKSLDNNNNKRLNENLDNKEFCLKDLFVDDDDDDKDKIIPNNNNSYCKKYTKSTTTIKQNSINKISNLFKRGLTRTTSESDIIHELRKNESNSNLIKSSFNNQTKTQLNNRSQQLINNSLSDSLNNSLTSNSLNGSIFERPGFGSIAFRNNLFKQLQSFHVVQMNKQLNEENCLDNKIRLDKIEKYKAKMKLNNKLTVPKPSSTLQQQQLNTNRLKLIQNRNKQLNKRNEEENDSIGNSVESSLSSRSTNSSTNSTLSSNLIETKLTDDLNMKLIKTRKSLKLIEQQQQEQNLNVNQQKLNEDKEKNMNNKELIDTVKSNQQIEVNQKEFDNQIKNEQQQINNLKVNKEINQNLRNEKMTEINHDKKDKLISQDNQNQLKDCEKNLKKLDIKIDQNDKLNDKNEQTECQKVITTRKYCETYEKLNRQSLISNKNRLNDKLYEKKSDKLLKIKDKFLNRLNARLDEDKKDEKLNKEVKKLNCSINSLDDSSNLTSSSSSNNNSLNKHQINQLDNLEWQDLANCAGTEIAIEKISTAVFCSTLSETENKLTNHSTIPIENKIKKFEKLNEINKSNNNNKQENENSHVYKIKLMVKNRELNESNNIQQKNLLPNLPTAQTESSSKINSLTSSNLIETNLESNSKITISNTVKNETTKNLPLNKILNTASSKLPTITSNNGYLTTNNTTQQQSTNLTISTGVNLDNLSKSNSIIDDKIKDNTVDNINNCKMNIELFLSNQNLEQFVDLFKREKINFEELISLNENDLTKLGFSKLEDKEKLLNAISSHRNTTKSTTTSKDLLEDTCL